MIFFHIVRILGWRFKNIALYLNFNVICERYCVFLRRRRGSKTSAPICPSTLYPISEAFSEYERFSSGETFLSVFKKSSTCLKNFALLSLRYSANLGRSRLVFNRSSHRNAKMPKSFKESSFSFLVGSFWFFCFSRPHTSHWKVHFFVHLFNLNYADPKHNWYVRTSSTTKPTSRTSKTF